jgi:hypothetical protein
LIQWNAEEKLAKLKTRPRTAQPPLLELLPSARHRLIVSKAFKGRRHTVPSRSPQTHSRRRLAPLLDRARDFTGDLARLSRPAT